MNSNRLLNSFIPPVNLINSAIANINANANTNAKGVSLFAWSGILIFIILLGVFITLMVVFRQQIEDSWNSSMDVINGYFKEKPQPQVTNPSPQMGEPGEPEKTPSLVEKILPGGSDVFNVSSNKYTFYDAEPLCKAFGAELATYDQVKDAWAKGADWCNYGWVKGQMAVYPTSDKTYAKLQAGPEDQRMACGQPGLNGGYFDNPEMRFGVTCYGNKPPQSKHDEKIAAIGTPISPDALAFDKKVSQFKSDADHVGILPFNHERWN